MKSDSNSQKEQEAAALAACYRLLLQKAAERRARLAEKNDLNKQKSWERNKEIND